MAFLNGKKKRKNTFVSSLAYYFKNHYRFSSAISETLAEDVLRLTRIFNSNFIGDGQVLRYVVSISEPPGKNLKECEFVPVKLTLYHPEDTDYRKCNGLKELKLKIIQRITQEAVTQGGSLSQEEIADLLFLDRRTVVEYIKELESRGIKVITRAKLPLLLTSSLNKQQIVKMFLQGFSEAEISFSTGYSKTFVEMCIEEFLRIGLLYRQGIKPSSIADLTGSSPELVKEQVDIYNYVMGDDKLSQFAHKIFSFYEGPDFLGILKAKEQFLLP